MRKGWGAVIACAAQEPGQLTVGTPEANGQGAKSVGYLRITTVTGDPTTVADEADVQVLANIADVRLRSDLSDYTGDLRAGRRHRPGVHPLAPDPVRGERRHDDRLHLSARHNRRGAGNAFLKQGLFVP